MTQPARNSPVFPEAIPPFVHGLITAYGDLLKTDPGSEGHAAVVGKIAAVAGLTGMAWARQVHGGTVLRVDGPGCAGEADALWTDRPGLGVIGRSADCPLVLVAGRHREGTPLWGMAHASWRSTAAEITSRLLAAMADGGLEPATAQAAIAPSAGPCCYEVGDEVREALVAGVGVDARSFFEPYHERWRLDLWAANTAALTSCGVPPAAVSVTDRCTICGEGLPSYRREGALAMRFGVYIGVLNQTN